jgi:hypothetical protein
MRLLTSTWMRHGYTNKVESVRKESSKSAFGELFPYSSNRKARHPAIGNNYTFMVASRTERTVRFFAGLLHIIINVSIPNMASAEASLIYK